MIKTPFGNDAANSTYDAVGLIKLDACSDCMLAMF